MEEKIITRLFTYLQVKKIPHTRFEKEIGLSNGYLNTQLKRNSDLGESVIRKIIDNCLDIDLVWLLTGKGRMLKIEEKTIESPQLSLPSMDDNFIRIPVVDIAVAAGTGYCNPDYIEEVECISMPRTMIKNGCTYLCVRVKGQSMMPSILDGGYLVVRLMERHEWSNIRDNYVYVVSDRDGKAYVKRLKNRLRQHGFIVCMSDNVDKQNYANFNIYNEELNSVWFAEWYFTAKIPNIQETFYRKQSEFEDRLDELTSQYKQLAKAIEAKSRS
jgi:transcriptional regulator